MGWLAYLIGVFLFVVGLETAGVIVFVFGMLCHWQYWTLGIIGFFIGLNITR